MTSKDLFKEMNNIDDNFIDEASDFVNTEEDARQKFAGKKKLSIKRSIFRAVGAFAALCVVVCTGWGISRINPGGEENETKKLIYVEEYPTEIGRIEEVCWVRKDEFVYFGGHMYDTYSKSSITIGETIEETSFKKGTLLGKVEDSEEYGESIYKGCPIYSVEGRKGTRQIIVEHEGELLLFSLRELLYTPDMGEELRICGVFAAEDIQSVTLKWNRADGGTGDYQSKKVITDKAVIDELYNTLITVSLDKDGYNEALKPIVDADLKEWKESGGGEVQTAEDGSAFTTAYRGTTAFDNSVSIELLSYDNEELEFTYYPKLNYMSFFKATQELVDWIAENQG